MTFNEHKIFQFDNEQDIHLSSKNYAKSGHGFTLDLQAIS